MKNLIIVGAGGFGLEVAAYAEDMHHKGKGGFTVKGFMDDAKKVGSNHANYPILSNTNAEIDKGALYIIAVGAPLSRAALAEKLAAKGATFTTIIHPQSYVATGVKIGDGSIIAPFAFVGPKAHVGKQCVLNVHACVGHEATLGDYCILSPGAGLNGSAILEEGVFMGSDATITAGQRVGKGAKISAGAVVYTEIPADVVALGNPAAFRQN